MPLVVPPLVLFCDNSEAMAQSKKPRNHRKGKHIERKCHLICEIVMKGDVVVDKIASIKNLVDPFMKTLSIRVFDHPKDSLGVRCAPSML